jgi:hypothetical protein
VGDEAHVRDVAFRGSAAEIGDHVGRLGAERLDEAADHLVGFLGEELARLVERRWIEDDLLVDSFNLFRSRRAI